MRVHELGHVVLYVLNLERSANFYRDTLGFSELHRDLSTAFFGAGRTHHELLLIEVGGKKEVKSYPDPGLYHIGFKIGNTDDELRSARDDLEKAGVPITGMADHHVTHSLYIQDPDGNEIELYIDVNDEWKRNPASLLQPVKRLVL